MSQFNKYLEIVQEDKYQYNETFGETFKNILNTASEIGQNIKDMWSGDVYSKIKYQGREIVIIKDNFDKIEEEIKETYPELKKLNSDSKLVYYFLKHKVVPIMFYTVGANRRHIILASTEKVINPETLPKTLEDIETEGRLGKIKYPSNVYKIIPQDIKDLKLVLEKK